MPKSELNDTASLSPNAQRLLAVMRNKRQYSRAELLQATDMDASDWKASIDALLEAQAVVKIGIGRATQYYLPEPKPAPAQIDEQLNKPTTIRRRTAMVRPSSSDTSADGAVYGSKGLDLAPPQETTLNNRENPKKEHKNTAESQEQSRENAPTSPQKEFMERRITPSILSNSPYALPVTGSIKNQIAATTTGKHKTVFVGSSRANFASSLPPVHRPPSSSAPKTISRQHPALAKNDETLRRPNLREPKLIPLPIASFRNDRAGRYEINEEDLRAALKLDATELFLPLLSTSNITQHFWHAFSAIANSGGGTILFGVRTPRNGKYFIKGVRQHRELVENLHTHIAKSSISSEFITDYKDILSTKLCKKTIVVVKVDKSKLSTLPVFVGFDSFSKKPRHGCFIIKDHFVQKCTEEECKTLWQAYIGECEADWDQSSTLRFAPSGKHRSIAADDTPEPARTITEKPSASGLFHKVGMRPPAINSLLRERLIEIAEPAHSFQRLPLSRMCEIATEMCRLAALSIDDLSLLLDRKKPSISKNLIPRLMLDPRMHFDESTQCFFYI